LIAVDLIKAGNKSAQAQSDDRRQKKQFPDTFKAS
jgi:hypothetical protein